VAIDYVGSGVRCNGIRPGTIEALDEYEAIRAEFIAASRWGASARPERSPISLSISRAQLTPAAISTWSTAVGAAVPNGEITMTIALRGMAWSHPRGFDPFVAASKARTAQTGVEILWDKRSLQDFEIVSGRGICGAP
jgi:hypothetical protein